MPLTGPDCRKERGQSMTQEAAAAANGIALRRVDEYRNISCSVPLLMGKIRGAEVYYHTLLPGDRFYVRRDPEWLKTLVLIDGEVLVKMEDEETGFKGRASLVADPEKALEVQSRELSHVLEVRRELGEARSEAIRKSGASFPMVQDYYACDQYREDFKSRKSISRSMIDHHLLPDYCMGSNESYGPDRVEKHAHPLLDQFFFSFEDNEVDLMIDDMIQPFEPNTLLHIPLGSDHGVMIPEGKKMHYIWIDFMVDPGAVAYLDEVHKKTGVLERYDENHRITE